MISVVYCTREPNPAHTKHIIETSGLNKFIEVIEIVNKGEALTQAYNRGLAMAKNDVVVFMHDDVKFDTTGWGNKLLKHFNLNPEYGILGLAGTTDLNASGRWWEDRSKMVGIVNHFSDGKKWESKYSKNWGNEMTDVVVVDGLFFAAHKQRIKKNFDNDINGFHFYDIDFTFSNHLEGVKIAVIYNIRVTHNSIGVTNDEWEQNRIQFVKKHNDELPEKLVPEYYIPKATQLKNPKIQTKVIIQSTGDIEAFHNLYNKIRSFNYPHMDFYLISTDADYIDLKDINLPSLKVFEGPYDTLPKNLSILKYEDNFLTETDDLIFFMNDNVEIFNDIISNFVKLYQDAKNTFGCGFPLSYNINKSVFSSSLDIMVNKDNQIGIEMKDNSTYYNVGYGQIINPIGNLADFFVTTKTNLILMDWFKLNYLTPLYFNDFSLRLFLKNKLTFNDTNSVTVQKSFMGQTTIQQDFQNIIDLIGGEAKLQETLKKIG